MGSAPQMILTQETVTLDSKQPLATKNLGLTRARDLPNILLLMVDVALPDAGGAQPSVQAVWNIIFAKSRRYKVECTSRTMYTTRTQIMVQITCTNVLPWH